MSKSNKKNQAVWEIERMEDFICDVGIECMVEILYDISHQLTKNKNHFIYLIEDVQFVRSVLISAHVADEVYKYVFSTALHKDKKFIKPIHIDIIVEDLTEDLTDVILLKMSEIDIIDLYWVDGKFSWKLKD